MLAKTCSLLRISLGCPVGQDRPLVHRDDARAVREDDVHVVLDDDRGDPSRAHHLRDDVHDRRLLARADAARRLVEEQELGAERVGDRDVEELALALGEAAREHARLGQRARTAGARPWPRSRTARPSRRARRAAGSCPPARRWTAPRCRAAESWSKRLTSWKLRAMPAAIFSWMLAPVMSASRKRIVPESGWMSPLIRLTSVVLPAPLEPMSASTSPSRTVKSTWSTACVSPKYLVSWLVASRLTTPAPSSTSGRAAPPCP